MVRTGTASVRSRAKGLRIRQQRATPRVGYGPKGLGATSQSPLQKLAIGLPTRASASAVSFGDAASDPISDRSNAIASVPLFQRRRSPRSIDD
jgi:hypothetical protein